MIRGRFAVWRASNLAKVSRARYVTSLNPTAAK
jgi:hypothetical protein